MNSSVSPLNMNLLSRMINRKAYTSGSKSDQLSNKRGILAIGVWLSGHSPLCFVECASLKNHHCKGTPVVCVKVRSSRYKMVDINVTITAEDK